MFNRFLPVVKQSTAATGVTSTYKRVLDMAEANKYLAALLGAVANPQSFDLDAYITNQALNGLFQEMARQEMLIRRDPLARTTQLLREVFGAVTRPPTTQGAPRP